MDNLICTATTTQKKHMKKTNLPASPPQNNIKEYIHPRSFRKLKPALAWAKKTGLPVWSIEVSKRGARTYYVGDWITVVEIVSGNETSVRELKGNRICPAYGNLSALYEVLTGSQKVLPYIDMEFYIDTGNLSKRSIMDLNLMTCAVSALASNLLHDLFPDDIQLEVGNKTFLQVPKAWEKSDAALYAHSKYYVKNTTSNSKKTTIRSGIDWLTLDASKGTKRSRHLNLDSETNICFRTMRDLAIFMGLLCQRILLGCFSSLPEGKETEQDQEFQMICRELMVGETEGGGGEGKRIWSLYIDPVVYKKSQLWRVPLCSKYAADRPLLVCRPAGEESRPFDPSLTGRKPQDMNRDQIRTVIYSRLVGKIPEAAHALSFAKYYPQLFGLEEPSEELSSELNVQRWCWIPSHTGTKMLRIPTVEEDPAWRIKPWTDPKRTKLVLDWLRSILPNHKIRIMTQPKSAGSRKKYASGNTVTSSVNGMDLKTGQGSEYQRSTLWAICQYILMCSALEVWHQDAREGNIGFKNTINSKTGPQVLVNTYNTKCPKTKGEHGHGRAYLVIHRNTGRVYVNCLSKSCTKYVRLPPIMMEHRLVIWPPAEPSSPAKTEFKKHTKNQRQKKRNSRKKTAVILKRKNRSVKNKI